MTIEVSTSESSLASFLDVGENVFSSESNSFLAHFIEVSEVFLGIGVWGSALSFEVFDSFLVAIEVGGSSDGSS